MIVGSRRAVHVQPAALSRNPFAERFGTGRLYHPEQPEEGAHQFDYDAEERAAERANEHIPIGPVENFGQNFELVDKIVLVSHTRRRTSLRRV